MQAMLVHRLGLGPEALILTEQPDPRPGPGEVVVAVEAAGVNFADGLMLAGHYQNQPALPFAPGLEVAGTIAAVGAGVAGLAPGTRVLALPACGGYATRVAVPAARVVVLPAAMPMVTAAGFAVAYGTGHLALVHRARLQPGDTLLVLGAAGGVGLTAVELGVLLGARVIAVAQGPAKLALAAAKGAAVLIDADTADLKGALLAATRGRGVDVIYDPVGGALFDQALKAAAFEARVLAIGFASGTVPQVAANRLLVKNVDLIGFWWGAYGDKAPAVLTASLEALIALWCQGRLSLHVSETRPLAQAGEALALVQGRRATGKVVLTIP